MVICPFSSYVTGFVQLCLNNKFAMRNNIFFILFIYGIGLWNDIEWSWVIGNICESICFFKKICLLMWKEGILAYVINN